MFQTQQNLQKPIESFTGKIICGDALKVLKTFPDECVDCVITSPPYFNLRNYGMKGQIGLEADFNDYLKKLLLVFDEVKRVLKPEGSCWVVISDTYGGSSSGDSLRQKIKVNSPPKKTLRSSVKRNKYRKSLLQIPSRLSVAMIERGWILRNEIIWHKPNCLPSSATDRFTVDFEKLFFFVKNRKYYFNQQFEPLRDTDRLKRPMFNTGKNQKYKGVNFSAINHQTFEKSRFKMLTRNSRNKRSVWTIGTTNFSGQHFAVYPPKLIETPILASCPRGGIVLDPFIGSGTTAMVAKQLKRQFIGIELNPKYVKLARSRTHIDPKIHRNDLSFAREM